MSGPWLRNGQAMLTHGWLTALRIVVCRAHSGDHILAVDLVDDYGVADMTGRTRSGGRQCSTVRWVTWVLARVSVRSRHVT